jgi:hypothetical protein
MVFIAACQLRCVVDCGFDLGRGSHLFAAVGKPSHNSVSRRDRALLFYRASERALRLESGSTYHERNRPDLEQLGNRVFPARARRIRQQDFARLLSSCDRIVVCFYTDSDFELALIGGVARSGLALPRS